MSGLWQDVRFGAKLLVKSPAFTLVAVLSLGLGIGANTAIFSLVNAVFFRTLGAAKPEQLVSMFTTDPASPGYLLVSQPNYRDVRERTQTLSGFAAYYLLPLNLTLGGQPEQLSAEMVTGNYFEVMGARAELGRTITPEHDEPPGAHAVAVISHRLWVRRFGRDPNVIGREIPLNGRAFTVIGVMPEELRGLATLVGAQAWVPASMYRELRRNCGGSRATWRASIPTRTAIETCGWCRR
jgi:hypothetical protein